MGWIQRMQRARVRKKRRKLEYKIKRSYGSANKTAKYQRKLDALNAKFPPTGSRSSATAKTAPFTQMKATTATTASKPSDDLVRAMEYRQKEFAQMQAMMAQSKNSENASPASQKSASSVPQRKPTVPATGPSIPAGNYFASHEQLISKIARTAAQRCAQWIRRQDKEWKPINNGYSSQYSVDISVSKEGVEFNKLAYEGLHSIWFQGLGMSNLQQMKTVEFLHALKPYLDVYFPQEVEKSFADVSPLIKRTTSVTFDKVLDNIDFDGRSHYNKSIRVTMKYTFPPAPKLKSW